MISKGRVLRIGLFFALANFLITAVLGVLLRYNVVFPIADFSTRYWIHGHSHVGFLGWVFMALAILGFGMLLPKNARINRGVYRLIIYMQIAVLGMLVTFPFMGYAVPSIVFSTLHMVLSLFYALIFFKNADEGLESRYMRTALVFMLISAIGPLALGPVIALDQKETAWYDMAIYFYLHFQYNGWFTLGVFSLFFKLIRDSGVAINGQDASSILRLLTYAIIMTLALSALGFGFSIYVRIVGLVGAALQLWAGYLLLRLIFVKIDLSNILVNNWVKWFLALALFSWLIKIIMQLFSGIPIITEFAYFNRNAIMSYLHLSFLGFVSSFLIGLLIAKNFLTVSNPISKVGYVLFLISVFSMELTLGLKSIPQYLNLSIVKVLDISLLVGAVILSISLVILLFFAFIFPNRAMKQRRFT